MEKEALNDLTSIIKTKLLNIYTEELKSIYLFGSYARGNYDPESDLDLLVIISSDDLKKHEEQVLEIAVDLSIEYDIVITIFIEYEKHYNKYKDLIPLYKNIGKEGIIIHAA